jgi:hypothetical protein
MLKVMEVEDLGKNGKTYQAIVKEVFRVKFWDEDAREPRTVVVYKVMYENFEEPYYGLSKPLYQEFYVASIRSLITYKDYVMGVGDSIMNALKDAERNLERIQREIYGNDYPEEELPVNPFKEALKIFREQEGLEGNNNNTLLNY